jgi:hypothetical protein
MHHHQEAIITGVVTLIIGVGIGYAGAGVFNHPAAQPSSFARGAINGGGMMRGGFGGNGSILSGTVASEDSGSITLNTRDGSSHVVLLTPATTVSKSVEGTLTDIATGASVIISGTQNSDGSVSATNIQLRPVAPAQ